tara:strand:+ start:858 stop:1148 length:291 start_codon:yes stop_codon:yes gene_type:complete
MGNYLFSEEKERQFNDYYLKDLRRWERKIQENNYSKNVNTNNGPDYMKVLDNWVDNIKINNFKRNNNTNNPPNYVNYLKQENILLREKFNELTIRH